MLQATIEYNFAQDAQSLNLALNDELHRCHLRYLELALLYLKRGYRLHAARCLRAFSQAEALRRKQRKQIKHAPPSPHEARQMMLKQALRTMIFQSLPRGGVA